MYGRSAVQSARTNERDSKYKKHDQQSLREVVRGVVDDDLGELVRCIADEGSRHLRPASCRIVEGSYMDEEHEAGREGL